MSNGKQSLRKPIILSLTIIMGVSIFSGFALSRSVQRMKLRMHGKDLREDGLFLLKPSDLSFDVKFTKEMEGESDDVANRLKPFSVFLENRSQQTVVAYMVEWCFTKNDGTKDCYRKVFASPKSLIDGEATPDGRSVAGELKPNSTVLLSLISRDGSGPFRIPISREEADRFKQGYKVDRDRDRESLLLRHTEELANYGDVTVSLDGAFLGDGTFIGDNTSVFLNRSKRKLMQSAICWTSWR